LPCIILYNTTDLFVFFSFDFSYSNRVECNGFRVMFIGGAFLRMHLLPKVLGRMEEIDILWHGDTRGDGGGGAHERPFEIPVERCDFKERLTSF